MQWMFSFHGKGAAPADLKQLDFIAKHGFNFIRIPMDYRFWTKDFDYKAPDERVFDIIDTYLDACRERGLHVSLNLHRAPGYCVNSDYVNPERHSLWTDEEAQDGFLYIWEYFARRYAGIPSEQLDFNLLNEPTNVGNEGLTRENHEKIMRRTIRAIRDIDPERQIALDGIALGNEAIPELADTGAIHCGRGYYPYNISHYRATWFPPDYKWVDTGYPCMLPVESAVWPAVSETISYDGERLWDKKMLKECYEPWRGVEAKGVEIFMNECGCFNMTPNDAALAFMGDILSIFREYKWGYALWNFKGSYGLVEHGKPGASYEVIDGFKVDRALLELMKDNMVK